MKLLWTLQFFALLGEAQFVPLPGSLENIGVFLPPRPRTPLCHTEVLVQHVFAQSWGKPFIGTYYPPQEASCSQNWDLVSLNLSAVSLGRQFDRLGSIVLGGVEIWRTSTAEPTRTGIHWSYVKDITRFSALLLKSQSLVVDLPNNIVGPYDGSFNITIEINFYRKGKAVLYPDEIIPLSNGPLSYMVSLPPTFNYTMENFPRNIERAYLEVFASGAGEEEQWYTNVDDNCTHMNEDNILIGNGAFRSVNVFLDGMVIGFFTPFPIIYTGGIVPGLWRPVAAIGAFDQPSYLLDLTALLPILCDGLPHNFEIKVRGLPDINSYWLLSAHVLMYRDHNSYKPTSGKIAYIRHKDSNPTSIVDSITPNNKSFDIETQALETLEIGSLVTTSSGDKIVETLYRTQFINKQHHSNFTFAENTRQTIYQYVSSYENQKKVYGSNGIYTTNVDENFKTYKSNGFSIDGKIKSIFKQGILDPNTKKYSWTHIEQEGQGYYFANKYNNETISFGSQELFYSVRGPNLYNRHIKVINNTIVEDSGVGAEIHPLINSHDLYSNYVLSSRT